MITVSDKQLRARLAAYLRRAQDGDRVLVTRGGLVVAELRRFEDARADAASAPELQTLTARLGRLASRGAGGRHSLRATHVDASLSAIQLEELLERGA
ncbi:MAG: hypothetical protein HY906_19445 [Deltaproteobacteria bacterium]|nr:hypothetical protein [Deltaproteobacteria bacterium]